MGQITRQQRDTYLQDGGSRCPFCGSQSMASEVVMYDRLTGEIHCQIECISCHKDWVDIFTLTNIRDCH